MSFRAPVCWIFCVFVHAFEGQVVSVCASESQSMSLVLIVRVKYFVTCTVVISYLLSGIRMADVLCIIYIVLSYETSGAHSRRLYNCFA